MKMEPMSEEMERLRVNGARLESALTGAQIVVNALEGEVQRLHPHISELMEIIGSYARRDARESEILQAMQAEIDRLKWERPGATEPELVDSDRVAAHEAVKSAMGSTQLVFKWGK